MADLDELLRQRAASDPRLRAIIKRIGKGNADFSDTADYSKLYSKILGETLSQHVIELSPDEREELCESLLRGSYEEINDVLAQVQTSLDEKTGVHIRPQRATFPTERVTQLAHSLSDPTADDSVIKRRANTGAANVSMSFHDDYIKENAGFRNDAGLRCHITRIASAKACNWCTEVSGKFRFGDQPEDVFRRHDNCYCTIVYDGQVLRGRQNTDGSRSKTWEKVPNAPDYKPTVLSQEETRKLERRNLQQFRGLTLDPGNGTIKLGINLFDKADPIYVDAFSIEEEPGFKDVMLHGSSSSVQIIRNGKPVDLTPEEFAVVLRQNGYTGGDIRLASCETGKGENSFAQQLSKTLGVRVKAPDADVYYAPSEGTLFIGDPYINTGKWRLFDNGVEVND